MGISIVLRTKEDGNYYRQALLGLIDNDDIDAVLLSYPYFQELKPYTKNNRVCISNYSIIDDGLIRTFTKQRKKKFWLGTITSSKNAAEWHTSYRNFVNRVNYEITQRGLSASVGYKHFISKGKDRLWHAKIAIGFSNSEPVVLIIGSSNLTRGAFQEINKYFNYECDVILWSENKYKQVFINSFNRIDPVGDGPNIPPIFAVLDEDVEQLSEKQIMERFYSSFRNADEIEIEE